MAEAEHPSPIQMEVQLNRAELPLLDSAQMLYAMLDLRSKEALNVSRRRLNLALVIDRSTSMQGARIRNVKMAAMDLLETLQPDDWLSIVSFSDRAEVVIPPTPVRERRSFSSAIASLLPRGGTEIYQGLLSGLSQVGRHASPDYVNHVLLLTDGRTYGDEELALHATQQALKYGIGVSAFGIGEDWNDVFLDNLARKGGGVSQYISSPSQMREMLREEIQGLSKAVVKSMSLRIEPSAEVHLSAAFKAAPYMELFPCDESDKAQEVALGGLTAEEPVVVMLELVVDPQEKEKKLKVLRLQLEAEDVHLQQEIQIPVSLSPEEGDVPSRLFNFLERISVFRLQEKAWIALESGDAKQATSYLQAAATRLFDMGYRDLAKSAMLEVGRMARGRTPTGRGRKKLRYGTRSLSIPST
jgi:Ca-activated chloride channel homolog